MSAIARIIIILARCERGTVIFFGPGGVFGNNRAVLFNDLFGESLMINRIDAINGGAKNSNSLTASSEASFVGNRINTVC